MEGATLDAAAELVATYWDMRACKPEEFRFHAAAERHILALARAKGLAEEGWYFVLPAAPAPAGRGMSLLAQAVGGEMRACLVFNEASREQLRRRLSKREKDILGDPWVWTNPYVLGRARTEVLWHHSRWHWWWGLDPEDAMVSRTAWAALVYEECKGRHAFEVEHELAHRSGSPEELLSRKLYHTGHVEGEEERVFAAEGEVWSPRQLQRVLTKAAKQPGRTPPEIIPLYVLREGREAPLAAVLRYLCKDPKGPGMTQAEAGRALGMSAQAVSNALRRAELLEPADASAAENLR